MDTFICVTCGTQFPPSEREPDECPICLDERQYVGPDGQQWTTMAKLAREHRNHIEQVEPGLRGIGTDPSSRLFSNKASPVRGASTPQGRVVNLSVVHINLKEVLLLAPAMFP